MNPTDQEARQLIEAHVATIQALFYRSSLASWEAATTGREEAIRESASARTAVKRAYSDAGTLDRIRGFLASGEVTDAWVRRQLVLLEHGFTANQLPEATLEDLANREAELEGIFYNFRAELEGAELSNNELRELLVAEPESERRRRIWEASKGIGPRIAPPLLDLVRRRNAAARNLGFDNYYSMELTFQEFDEAELFALLEDFRARSDDSFRELRARVDAAFCRRFGVSLDELRPWHWGDFFSQEAPSYGDLDLDPLFEGFDHETFVRDYFAEIGLPIEDVLAKSDLYEREGKDQHAFCTDIDREGDVRILCNLRSNERWMRTLLHELGHAVYDKYIPRALPYLLRTPAHTLSTESIAMFFGRLTRDPEWLRSTIAPELSLIDEEEVNDQQKLSMLVATRWMLVMVHFERELYRNPDREDLNQLWWDLVEELQLVRRPDGRDEPDWATKIHLALAPVYYHNYLLGELMASQLTHAMREEGIGAHEVGTFLRERVFAHGATMPWNGLLVESTGHPLAARHFVDQFVGEPLAGGA